MTVQGIGIQQHSYPSHSRHFVFPAAPLSGFTIEEMVEAALEPGPLRLTRLRVEVHILFVFAWVLEFFVNWRASDCSVSVGK